jgi:hypothetical protein
LKTGSIGCPETSVTICQSRLTKASSIPPEISQFLFIKIYWANFNSSVCRTQWHRCPSLQPMTTGIVGRLDKEMSYLFTYRTWLKIHPVCWELVGLYLE